MNINPTAINVLCYGDSNTNGAKPDRKGRFAVDERWTGLLQKQLGDKYNVIEEGLGGRTTDLEHYDPAKPSRNGLTYFKACIDSHMPLDVIIIMLGTNDLKTIYDRSVEDVATALKQYPAYVTEYCTDRNVRRPKIVLASPAYMDENASRFIESMPKPGVYDEISAQKSRHFAEPFQRIAREMDCEFLDAAQVTETGADGCHLTMESHERLADALAELITRE